MGYRLSSKAKEDLVNITEQGARLFGYTQSKKYNSELRAIFKLIAANPRMERERLEFSPPVRVHPHRAHLVIYRIEENGDIFIIRIPHQREDWLREYRH
jgi:toxin ParE1/3/4